MHISQHLKMFKKRKWAVIGRTAEFKNKIGVPTNLRWRGTKSGSWSWICRLTKLSIWIGKKMDNVECQVKGWRDARSGLWKLVCRFLTLLGELFSPAWGSPPRTCCPMSAVSWAVWGGHGNCGVLGLELCHGWATEGTWITSLWSSWVNKKCLLV